MTQLLVKHDMSAAGKACQEIVCKVCQQLVKRTSKQLVNEGDDSCNLSRSSLGMLTYADVC